MPRRQVNLYTGGIYHVFNRGVDKRQIFMDNKDRLRFVYNLHEFNDVQSGNTARQRFERFCEGTGVLPGDRQPLVGIIAFALMPNHYHLLLQQLEDGGVQEYMKRLGGGYANYFNIRHERGGVLFQGRFRVKEVDENRYLQHVVTYIHANPEPILRGRELHEYRWSTYPAYLGDEKTWPWAETAAEAAESLGIALGARHQDAVQGYLKSRKKIAEAIGAYIIE